MGRGQAGKRESAEKIWVLGAGKFGLRAALMMRKELPAAAITLVDSRQLTTVPAEIECVCADAVDWLVEHLTPDTDVAAIIPAVPLHLAAEWLKRKIMLARGAVSTVEITAATVQGFPNPCRLSPSQLAVSHADFLCPENCAEPEGLCTVTGQDRPAPLYRLLERTGCGNYTPLIVRSRQFGPGVGGYAPADLWELYRRARALRNIPLLIGTACKCHGIIDGLRTG